MVAGAVSTSLDVLYIESNTNRKYLASIGEVALVVNVRRRFREADEVVDDWLEVVRDLDVISECCECDGKTTTYILTGLTDDRAISTRD